MIYLVVARARPTPTATSASVSIWVESDTETQALEQARAGLAEQGWEWLELDMVSPTEADDYFRDCDSSRAFQRACEAGIAYRFPDTDPLG